MKSNPGKKGLYTEIDVEKSFKITTTRRMREREAGEIFLIFLVRLSATLK